MVTYNNGPAFTQCFVRWTQSWMHTCTHTPPHSSLMKNSCVHPITCYYWLTLMSYHWSAMPARQQQTPDCYAASWIFHCGGGPEMCLCFGNWYITSKSDDGDMWISWMVSCITHSSALCCWIHWQQMLHVCVPLMLSRAAMQTGLFPIDFALGAVFSMGEGSHAVDQHITM